MNKRSIPLFFTLLILFPPILVQARETLSVDPDTVVQANFQGINAVYHGFSYLPESVEMGMTKELRALELARVKESGIRIARTFYRPDWAMGDGPWIRPDWDSAKMKALYAWLADLKRIKVDVALNMGWWFPRDVIWNRDQHLASYPDDKEAYCRWVSESIHQIVQVRGLTNVKYLVMFTEPADKYGDTPNGKGTWEYYAEVLQAVNRRLIDDGRRQLVKIVGPNTAQAPIWLDKATAELNDVIDIYASHSYNCTTYQEWYDLARKIKAQVAPTGKPFWIDEYGVPDFGLRQSARYGTLLALANAAFLNAGAQSSFLWILNDQYYPAPLKHLTNGDSFLDGKHSWGLFPWLPESRATRPGWDAFVLLSRFMGQAGGTIVKTQGLADLPIAATTRAGGEIDLLVVNGGQAAREVTIDFSREVTLPLYRYGYAPERTPRLSTGRLPVEGKRTSGRSLADTLTPGEVVIYSPQAPGAEDLVAHPESHAATDLDNLALHQPVTVSSADPGWPGANVTDGKRLTTWRSAGHAKRQVEEVLIDLGQIFEVQRIEAYPGYEEERGETNRGEGGDLRLMLSVDNKRWHRVWVQGQPRNAKAALVAAIPAQAVRYLRVSGKGSSHPSPDGLFHVSLGEVKVFGRRDGAGSRP